MVFGLSLAAFTLLHVAISLVAIVTGFVVVIGISSAKRLPGCSPIGRCPGCGPCSRRCSGRNGSPDRSIRLGFVGKTPCRTR